MKKVKYIAVSASALAFIMVSVFTLAGLVKSAAAGLQPTPTTTKETVIGTIASPENVKNKSVNTASAYKGTVLDLAYREYDGTDVIAVNGNMPFFTEDEITLMSFEAYSDLDDLGRAGKAVACLSRELMPTSPRDFDLSEVTPSGFRNRCYPELIEEDGWLYHRCHIIGYQLAGETTNAQNLFTGTRFLNEYGMLYQENAVAQYLRDYPDIHIMYRVTPIYREDELVARGVLMEAFSVEDNGGLQYCVFCYNVQPGIEIDYKTGNSYEK